MIPMLLFYPLPEKKHRKTSLGLVYTVVLIAPTVFQDTAAAERSTHTVPAVLAHWEDLVKEVQKSKNLSVCMQITSSK
jgi:hypothetical protein